MRILFLVSVVCVLGLLRDFHRYGEFAGFGMGLWLLPACLWPQALFAQGWLRCFGSGDGDP